jgi:hypothetical protein
MLYDETYPPLTLKASGKVLSSFFYSSTFSLPDFPPPLLLPLYFLHLIFFLFLSSSFSLPNSMFPPHILPFSSLVLFLQYAHRLHILLLFLVFPSVFFLCSLLSLLLHLYFRFLLYLYHLLLHLYFLSSPLVCSHSSFSHTSHSNPSSYASPSSNLPFLSFIFLLLFLFSPHQHTMSSGTERNYVSGKVG